MLLSKVRRIIDRFWKPSQQFDWLEMDYAIHDAHLVDLKRILDYEVDITNLIEKREKLRKAKKRHKHMDAEIELLRSFQMSREAQL